jgi:ABC-type bacteriocin/lantibiotic exporter with double-glycine peptidase domain
VAAFAAMIALIVVVVVVVMMMFRRPLFLVVCIMIVVFAAIAAIATSNLGQLILGQILQNDFLSGLFSERKHGYLLIQN